MANKITDRPFRVSDAQAIELSQVRQRLYEKNRAEFEGFDSLQFNPAFEAAWLAANDAATRCPTDEYTRDVLQGHTDKVMAAMDMGHAAINDLRYYAQQAFDGTDTYHVFHFAQQGKVRANSTAYVLYLQVQHRVAQMYWAELSAKGMGAGHLAALETASTAIAQADLDQELYKRQRTANTAERKRLMHVMWGFVQAANAAANIIYSSDPVKRALFNVG
jgi:hypothetical protein